MERKQIWDEVVNIFRSVFDDESLEINEMTNAEDIEDWDSLEQINLLVSMEKKFSIKFDIKEVVALENVGEIVKLIERKIK